MKLNMHTIALYILAISSTAYAAAPAEPTDTGMYIGGVALAAGTMGIVYACKEFTWAKINLHYRNGEPMLIAGQIVLCAAVFYGLYELNAYTPQLATTPQERQAAHSGNKLAWIGMCVATIGYYIKYWGLFP